MIRKIAWVLPLVCLLAACAALMANAGASGAATSHQASPSVSAATDRRVDDTAAGATRRPAGKCGSKLRAIESGNQTREYTLHVPARVLPSTPLVIVLHGYKGTAESMEQYSTFSSVADREGFLVAYPQAAGESAAWNLNLGPNNDVTFLVAVMDDVLAICDYDPSRVYVVGLSRGGGMANRLACDDARRVAAVAAVSGAFYRHLDCDPARAVPVLAIHGLKDAIVPFEGRPDSPATLHATPRLRDWAAAWAARDGCSAVPDSTSPVAGEQRKTWRNCRSSAEVVLCALDKAGHEWPYSPVNAADTVWDFFSRH
ncbi:MAG TPA: PHB depolymerase family esterase [Thermoflexales bacterium]|nr:PHB depolymerase family esterase [Thermoflexales bacterium]HQX10554.1 PHB depolymerase family esterase [Thermoflexales bacterium]HQY23324.1 PHB depolymerase family esterase [Thermoflexales bacterium]HQZ53285.1 PHB depolymerase family esterase [Thermoflexales bacterium]HRA53282.1 PHB depolymerase family esterase [Thermoflexales bacterium]